MNNNNKKQNTFEISIKRLEDIIKKFQQDDLLLDDSIKLYEEGIKLIQYCEDKLNQTKNTVYILKNQLFKKEEKENQGLSEEGNSKIKSSKKNISKKKKEKLNETPPESNQTIKNEDLPDESDHKKKNKDAKLESNSNSNLEEDNYKIQETPKDKDFILFDIIE